MRTIACAGSIFVCACLMNSALAQTGSAFAYQGRVTESGAPMFGTIGVQLSLWKDAFSLNAADRIGSVQTLNGVPVSNGVFSVVGNSLNEFGLNPFSGQAVWIQVAINGVAQFPRQQLLSTPYASGLSAGGGSLNSSSGTTTFSFVNQSTSTTPGGANALFVQRGASSGISLSSFYPGAFRVDSANVNGIVSTVSSNGGYGIFGLVSTNNGSGVVGRTLGNGFGVEGIADGATGVGVHGSAPAGGYAGRFDGRGLFTGNLGIGAAPTTPLEVQVASGQTIQFRQDGGIVPGMNVNPTGGNPGILRLRNALEIWPSDNNARAGKLDVRNTSGNATVSLDGATGNISANNLPGIASKQTFRDPRGTAEAITVGTGFLTVDTLSLNVPAAGALLVTATVNVNLNCWSPTQISLGCYFKLEDTTSGNSVLLTEVYGKSQGDVNPAIVGNAQTLTISWVVPVSGPGLKSFKTTLTNPGPNSFIFWTSTLNALYVPKTF